MSFAERCNTYAGSQIVQRVQEKAMCVWTAPKVTVTPYSLLLTQNNASKSHPTSSYFEKYKYVLLFPFT